MDRSMLNKATSADEVPTPGYIFTEIAKATADVNVSQQVADFLLRKLERDNPHVKLKVLKIIRHVCEQGKPDFRRAVQRRSELVKSCLQYRGTPDPLKGDAPNKAVREEAEVTVRAVFSSDSSTNAYGFAVEPAKKMTGFGSDNSDNMSGRIGGMGSDGQSSFNSYGGPKQSAYGSGMVGFGNPNFDNAPRDDKDTVLKQGLSSAMSFASKIGNKVQTMSGTGGVVNTSSPGGFEGTSSSYRAPPVGMDGHGFGGSGMQQDRWGRGAGAGGQSRPPPPSTASSGEYEARLVNELCAVGGARAAPPQQVIDDFCRKCSSLDAKHVAEQLRQKLEQPDWQVRLKALYGIEALAQQGLDGITGHICQFSSDLIFDCQEMPQCRQKATKVLQVLNFIDQADEQPAPRRSAEGAPPLAAEPAVACADLLSMDDDPLPAPPSASAIAAPSLEQDLMGEPAANLLDDGPVSAPAPLTNGHASASAADGVLGLFGDMTAPSTAAPAPAPSAPGGGLFGDLSMKGPPGGAAGEPPSLLASVEAAAAQPQNNGTPPLLASLQAGAAGAGAAPVCAFGAGQQAAPAQGAPLLQDRTAHLSVFSGGMAAQMPAQMQPMGAGPMLGNPMMPGPGAAQPPFGMVGAQPLGLPPQGYVGGGTPAGMPGMMSAPMATGAMGAPQQQPCYSAAPPTYAPPCMGGGAGFGMQHQTGMFGGLTASPAPAFPGAAAGGGAPMMSPAPGSAFGFIGAAGGLPAGAGMAAPAMGGEGKPASNDRAFGFVADEMMGLRS